MNNFFLAGIDSGSKSVFYKDSKLYKHNFFDELLMVFLFSNFSNILLIKTSNGYNIAKAEWENISLEIDLGSLEPSLRSRIASAKIVESGKDVEFWAGNYGSKYFKKKL